MRLLRKIKTMTYEQALQYIHSLHRFGVKPGLERIAALCTALGSPQERLRCVHVAGTNGKGSACAMLAGIAMAAGMKTGLYTSPYVFEFRERMRIDGEMIPEEDLCRWTQILKDIAEALPEPVTEFEFNTALAFAWFAEQGCELVVLEVGLGGRWDATNLIKAPLCSVIMKVALDHTEFLGDTLAKIAAEKCGIVKPGFPVVCTCGQDAEALDVIEKTCEVRNSPLLVAHEAECEVLRSSLAGSECVLAGLPVRVPLAGRHMCQNALAAVKTARLLGFSDEAIQIGISRVSMPGRMQVLSARPLVLFDGGHNADCARALAAALEEYCPGQRFRALCGMMADKDVQEYLRILRPHIGHFIACGLDNPRALSAEALAEYARAAGMENITIVSTPEEASRLVIYPKEPAVSTPTNLRDSQRTKGSMGPRSSSGSPIYPLLICGSFSLTDFIPHRV